MNWAAISGYAAANAGGSGSTRILAQGSRGWDAAVAWADQLVHGGYSNWRLPALNLTDVTCSRHDDAGARHGRQYDGVDCTGGELGGLFVTDLGNKALESVLSQVGDTAQQIANLALFSNVQPSDFCSDTAYAPSPDAAWHFETTRGIQSPALRVNVFYAPAVRPGDVTATVPEPQTLALALLTLGATMVARRRRSGGGFDAASPLTP